MTLLVLDVKDAAVASQADLVGSAGPPLVSYALGFVILGLLWNGQQVTLAYTERTDRLHLWLGIVFLLWAGLVPFPTALIAVWPVSFLAVATYAGVLALAALTLLAQWIYATHGRRLVAPDLPDHVVRSVVRRLVWATALYGVGVVVAVWSPPMGVAALAASHLFFVVRPVTDAETV